MFHHDERDYNVAASAAAKRGRDRLQAIIDKGRASAAAVIEQIQDRVISDRVVRAPLVRLTHDDDGDMMLSVGGEISPLHENAFTQLCGNLKVGKKLYTDLMDEAGGSMWGKELFASVANEVLAHRESQRNLIRSEGENRLVKGFLSDKFRRLDSRPVVDAFLGACNELGLLPLEGVASDTKMRLRAVLPYVFEPVDTEVMIFGAELGNSDYGDGGLVLNLWTMRVWCTNLGIAEKCLRQVHVGGKLPDNIRFSDETYRKDAETTALAVRDMTAAVIAPDRVNRMLAAIEAASEKELSGRDGVDKVLSRVGLDKNELATVKGLYDGPDVENLPPGDNVWRLSNAVSFMAQGRTVSPDRKIFLQTLAGELVNASDDRKVKEV